MSAVVEGPRIPLQVDVWRYLAPRTPLLGEDRPEPALMGWVEPAIMPPIVPAETAALSAPELIDPITLVSLPTFRPPLPFFPPLGGGTSTVTTKPDPGFSAVPEPSTWALLIVGFMFVGHALRGRRGQPVLAAT